MWTLRQSFTKNYLKLSFTQSHLCLRHKKTREMRKVIQEQMIVLKWSKIMVIPAPHL